MHDACLRLATGECDLNLTLRGPSEDELAAATEEGVAFELAPIARDAIAYSGWYYDRYMAMSPHTRTIAVERVLPTRETIASGASPLVTTIYAVHHKDEAPDSPTMKLIRWLRSEEGQAVVQESGYVKLPPAGQR